MVNLEFGGITASLAMEGLTSYAGRRTRIMGTRGDLVGDESRLEVFDFHEKKRYALDRRGARPRRFGPRRGRQRPRPGLGPGRRPSRTGAAGDDARGLHGEPPHRLHRGEEPARGRRGRGRRRAGPRGARER
ncbi:MAG: hypothetical protein MZU84_08430 [Sphingobacterium sp.]|nr:hypothetical protein [Sphingobacterium sp.]